MSFLASVFEGIISFIAMIFVVVLYASIIILPFWILWSIFKGLSKKANKKDTEKIEKLEKEVKELKKGAKKK